MLFFVGSGLQEQRSDLLKALLLGNGRKVGVLIAGLRFASKGLPQVLFGLGTGVNILLHDFFLLHFFKRTGGLLALGADKIFRHRPFMYITAKRAAILFHDPNLHICLFVHAHIIYHSFAELNIQIKIFHLKAFSCISLATMI